MKTEKLNLYAEVKQKTERDIFQSSPYIPTYVFSPSVPIPALNIDWLNGGIYTKDISANSTFTFSNATDGQNIIFCLTNTTATDLTLSWPVELKGADLTLPANKTKLFTFIKIGSSIYSSSLEY